jgi:outer membrane receptor protein involved in Fe transport
VDGQGLPGVPEWSAAVNFELGAPIWSAQYGYVRGDLQYVGDRKSSLGPAAEDMGSYTLVNLRAGLEFEKYSLSLFVNNLTDERAELFRRTIFGLREGNPLQLDRVNINRPRTIGISVKRSF